MHMKFGAQARRLLPALFAASSLAMAASGALAADGKILGVALPNLTNPYYVAMKKSFEENGAAQGFEVKVLIADNDDAKQLAQIQTFVEEGVDAVALNCVSSGPCVASVQELNTAKIPVFTINLLPDGDGLKQVGATVVQAVQTDQKMGGTYIGQQLVKDLGAGAKAVIGIVGEQTAAAANARDDGFKAAIATNPDLKVVAEVNGKVEETTTLKVVTEMLMGNPDMTIVFSSTEPSATGAKMAIEQLGRTDVMVYAFVDKIGVEAIQENSILKAGAIQEPARLAQILVENARKFLNGETVEPLVDSPPLLVNKDNAAEAAEKAY